MGASILTSGIMVITVTLEGCMCYQRCLDKGVYFRVIRVIRAFKGD